MSSSAEEICIRTHGRKAYIPMDFTPTPPRFTLAFSSPFVSSFAVTLSLPPLILVFSALFLPVAELLPCPCMTFTCQFENCPFVVVSSCAKTFSRTFESLPSKKNGNKLETASKVFQVSEIKMDH